MSIITIFTPYLASQPPPQSKHTTLTALVFLLCIMCLRSENDGYYCFSVLVYNEGGNRD